MGKGKRLKKQKEEKQVLRSLAIPCKRCGGKLFVKVHTQHKIIKGGVEQLAFEFTMACIKCLLPFNADYEPPVLDGVKPVNEDKKENEYCPEKVDCTCVDDTSKGKGTT